MNMKYVIYKSADIDKINFGEVFETSVHTLRYSNNNENVILKFKGPTPLFLHDIEQYSHEEILKIINDPENGWITN